MVKCLDPPGRVRAKWQLCPIAKCIVSSLDPLYMASGILPFTFSWILCLLSKRTFEFNVNSIFDYIVRTDPEESRHLYHSNFFKRVGLYLVIRFLAWSCLNPDEGDYDFTLEMVSVGWLGKCLCSLKSASLSDITPCLEYAVLFTHTVFAIFNAKRLSRKLLLHHLRKPTYTENMRELLIYFKVIVQYNPNQSEADECQF